MDLDDSATASIQSQVDFDMIFRVYGIDVELCRVDPDYFQATRLLDETWYDWGEGAALMSASYRNQRAIHSPEEFAYHDIVCRARVRAGTLYALRTTQPSDDHAALCFVQKIAGIVRLVGGVDVTGLPFLTSRRDPNLRWYAPWQNDGLGLKFASEFPLPQAVKMLFDEAGGHMLRLGSALLLKESRVSLSDVLDEGGRRGQHARPSNCWSCRLRCTVALRFAKQRIYIFRRPRFVGALVPFDSCVACGFERITEVGLKRLDVALKRFLSQITVSKL